LEDVDPGARSAGRRIKGIAESVDILLRKTEAWAMIVGDDKLDRRSSQRLPMAIDEEKEEQAA
jgi:hypothetical protein